MLAKECDKTNLEKKVNFRLPVYLPVTKIILKVEIHVYILNSFNKIYYIIQIPKILFLSITMYALILS